jgi:hypothetical protein
LAALAILSLSAWAQTLTNYSDQLLASGSYCYKVDATNSGGTSGFTSPVEATVQ